MIESKRDPDQPKRHGEAARLYSVVPVHGGRYRDFAGSRNETRVQFQHLLLREQGALASAAREQGATEKPPAVPEQAAEAIRTPSARALPVAWAPRGHELSPAALRQPQWLQQPEAREDDTREAHKEVTAGTETLQQAKERVASRWFALKSIFTPSGEPSEAPSKQEALASRAPVVGIFSLAGGVGKSSMAATLGRTLASCGERVLLVDTAYCPLLPFYFGSRDWKSGSEPGVLRTFSPPGGSGDAPVHAVALHADAYPVESGKPDPLLEEVQRYAHTSTRILIDVATAAMAIARRLLPLSPTFLVPILPDMNSVATLSAVEEFFAGAHDAENAPVQPVYLLNQFDASQALHLDVREILQQRLANRLLPFVLRRSPQLSEALADGMTVIDYAPASGAAEDYAQLANWLRNVSPAAAVTVRGIRWREQSKAKAQTL